MYTTRPDTLYGATYMVVSPEHPYLEKWEDKLQNLDAAVSYTHLDVYKRQSKLLALKTEEAVEQLG